MTNPILPVACLPNPYFRKWRKHSYIDDLGEVKEKEMNRKKHSKCVTTTRVTTTFHLGRSRSLSLDINDLRDRNEIRNWIKSRSCSKLDHSAKESKLYRFQCDKHYVVSCRNCVWLSSASLPADVVSCCNNCCAADKNTDNQANLSVLAGVLKRLRVAINSWHCISECFDYWNAYSLI